MNTRQGRRLRSKIYDLSVLDTYIPTRICISCHKRFKLTKKNFIKIGKGFKHICNKCNMKQGGDDKIHNINIISIVEPSVSIRNVPCIDSGTQTLESDLFEYQPTLPPLFDFSMDTYPFTIPEPLIPFLILE